MSTTRRSLKQVIADLEERESLSKHDADTLRRAPRWSLSGAEITAYLGGGIIAVGVTWIIIAIAQDLNRLTVYLAMYIFGAIALVAARLLRTRGNRSGQVAEALFGLGIGSLAGAVGLTLNDQGLPGPGAVAITSALAIIIGLAMCQRTLFIGTLIVVAATQPLIGSIGESFDFSESTLPQLMIVSGAFLVLLGFQRVGSALIARLAGSISIVIGSFVFAVMRGGSFRPIFSIVICATLFYVGTRGVNLEVIIGGGIGITIAIGILAERTLNAFVVQGAIVTATGAAISALSLVVIKRKDANSLKPESGS